MMASTEPWATISFSPDTVVLWRKTLLPAATLTGSSTIRLARCSASFLIMAKARPSLLALPLFMRSMATCCISGVSLRAFLPSLAEISP